MIKRRDSMRIYITHIHGYIYYTHSQFYVHVPGYFIGFQVKLNPMN